MIQFPWLASGPQSEAIPVSSPAPVPAPPQVPMPSTWTPEVASKTIPTVGTEPSVAHPSISGTPNSDPELSAPEVPGASVPASIQQSIVTEENNQPIQNETPQMTEERLVEEPEEEQATGNGHQSVTEEAKDPQLDFSPKTEPQATPAQSIANKPTLATNPTPDPHTISSQLAERPVKPEFEVSPFFPYFSHSSFNNLRHLKLLSDNKVSYHKGIPLYH